MALLSACGRQKSPGLQEAAIPPDKVLFENGMNFLNKNQFIRARLAFQTLINTYPESEYTPISFLSIADSYYNEGSTENLLQAEAQYKDFIIFYPTHEMCDDAQMKVAAINVRLMKPHDRDPTYARKAEVELRRMLDDFPDSELTPTAREMLREVQETLARGIHEVGEFYFSRRSYQASESRFREVYDRYPGFSNVDTTLFKWAESLEHQGRIDEAVVHYSRLAAEYPFSQHFAKAKEKLILLERPVPPVDTVAAARNEANRREEAFSLLNPIRSVWSIFAGQEDPYEVARRQAEERRGSSSSDGNPDSPPGREN